MDEELKLGYYRLGKRFEDSVELFVLASAAWAIFVILLAIVVVLSTWQWLGLILAGVGALYLFRGRLAVLGGRLRQRRIELEGGGERPDDRTARLS